MKKEMSNNLGLKILSLIFSIGLWLAVVNISDPDITTTFTGIPVEVENADLVTSEGKVYSVLDNTDVVSIKVTGKRSLIDAINKDDIHAVADLNDLSFMNTVSIKAVSSKYSSQLKLQCQTENLKLEIENIKRVQLPIETVTVGEPSEGYVIGNVITDQNIVRVSGPESLIEKIDHVEAEVTVTGWKTDIDTSSDLKLYDSEDNIIKSSSLTQNISSVKVTATILEKKEVPIKCSTSGTPAAGYMATGKITTIPETITIAGKKNVIDTVKEITIPDSALNITGQTANMTSLIEIKDYLPNGISVAENNFNGTVSVTVDIEAAETRDFDVPIKNISLTNQPSDYKVSIDGADDQDAVITIALTGLASKIIEMKDTDIYGLVDMNEVLKEQGATEWKEGIYTGQIKFGLSDDIITNNIYTVRIHVDKKNDDD